MSVDLGELRARLTADAREMRAELRAIREDLRGQSAEARAAAGSFDGLNNALGQLGLSAEQIRRIQTNLRNTNPEILRRQLEAVREQLRLLGLNADQIAEIEENLNDTADAADDAASSLGGVESVLVAIGGVVSLDKLAGLIKVTVGEATKLQNSLKGLNSIATAFHQDIDDTNKSVQSLAEDGLAPVSTYASGLKSLLSTGLGLEQANQLLETFKDRAAFGKSETISFSQAVENLAGSFKTESSEIGDLSGMTENYSYILEVGAKALGKKVTALSQAERAQAKYLGIMQVSKPFLGDAAKLTDSFSGRQAALNAKWVEAQQALGEAYIPALDAIMEKVTPIIMSISKWAAENKETVAGMTAATAAVVGMITVVTVLIPLVRTLTVAFQGLKTAAGWIGIALTGLTMIAGAVWAYKSAADATTESIWKFAQSQDELNQKLSESPLTRSVQEVKDLQADMAKINELLEERISREEELANYKPNSTGYNYLKAIIEDIDKKLSVLGVNTPEDAPKVMEELRKHAQQATGAIVEIERASMRETIAHADNVKEMKRLIVEYDKLNSSAKLTEEQKVRLETVVKALKNEYPDLIAQLDEENVWHLKNVDSLKEYVNGEENRVKAAGKASIDTLAIAQTEAKERVRLARETLKTIEAIESGETKPKLPNFGFSNPSPGMDAWTKSIVEKEKEKLQDEVNKGNFAINESKKLIEDLSTNNWDAFRTPVDTGGSADEKKAKSGKVKTLAELQQEQYQAALKLIEYKKSLNQMNEAQELAALEKLEKKYKKNAEIRMDLEVKVYKLKEQMQQSTFKTSKEWIDQEERRMTLAGKSDEQITQMKLDAWTRVRNRYQKDSELYKQADIQVYQAKLAQLKATTKAEEEAAKEREKVSKENTKKTIDAIEKAKKAELAALDDRRKAIEDFYKDADRAIDDKERLKERNDLTAEMEKYRYATSEKGQKTFLELQEKLRQMGVEDQKRNLQDERDQKLDALEKEKRDIETWFDELKEATGDLTNDLTALYKLADDERLNSFKETNALIIAEMQKLQAEMSASATINAGNASVVSQMMANSNEWQTASASRKKELEQNSYEIGKSQGWIRKADGHWYLPDGKTPAYHTGGIAGEMNFRSGSDLMPDEINAVLRRGEPVLTPQQVGSLVAVGGGGGSNVTIEKVVGVEMHDVTIEDDIDLRSFEKMGGQEAAEILRKQLSGGGG